MYILSKIPVNMEEIRFFFFFSFFIPKIKNPKYASFFNLYLYNYIYQKRKKKKKLNMLFSRYLGA
ncbi:hypothetical protein HanRHA438_Chr06g0286971 [Helianthus annuus]|nr:hypothetical protein HanRHA438_Chr06g0286971 [Helianthus annuus]